MNNKLKNKITSLSFVIFILLIFIFNIIIKDNLISLTERRKLEQFPNITIKNLLDGSFFNKFDKYTTDQFIMRDNLRLFKAKIELATKTNYNNLYLKDNFIIEQTFPLDINSIENITNKINFIKENYLKNNKIYFSIIPDKNYFINDNNLKIDYNKLVELMNKNLKDINYIDISNNLTLNNYYKTDTHWKNETLKDIANIFSNKMNFNISNNYKEEFITDFYGVYANRLPVNIEPDKIKILTNDIINNSTIYNYETQKEENIYNLNKVNSNDKYDIYLSGPVSLLKITNKEAKSKKDLIVFRDSYGSSIIPLFIEGYKTITVVDTRYISPNLLSNYIEFKSQDVLFLYSTLLINNSYSLK